MAKSPEQNSASAIVKALDKRSLSSRMIAYFIVSEAGWEILLELLEITLHIVKRIKDSPLSGHVTEEKARVVILCDSIVRAVEESGHEFN